MSKTLDGLQAKKLDKDALNALAKSLKGKPLSEASQEDCNALLDGVWNFAFSTAKARSKRYEDAEDIATEVSVKVLRSFQNFQGEAAFTTWVSKIVFNTTFRYLKKRCNTYTACGSVGEEGEGLLDNLVSREDAPSAGMEGQEELEKLKSAIDHLEEIYRKTLEKQMAGGSTESIARELGIPQGTVKSRLHNVRKIIRERIGGGMGLTH